MKEHTYQLSVELQVRSAKLADQQIEELWHTLLAKWLERTGLAASVSAIKCAEVHKFEELRWGPGSADPLVEAALVTIAILISEGADGGFGEFDNCAKALVKSRWPNVTDWECGRVTCSEGVVTLHDLYVVA